MKAELFLKLALLGLASLAPVSGAETVLSATFTNPNRPGIVRIKAGRNQINVRGVDGNEVRATSTKTASVSPAPAQEGLRVLTPPIGFTLYENNNVVQLDAGTKRGVNESAGSIDITVPRASSVVIMSDFDGDVSISDIAGDVEVRAAMGKVQLERLRGGADIQTNRGGIEASFSEVASRKPLAFSSMMGAVVVRIPATAKALVKLRSQNGQILTDFSEAELAIRTETMTERQAVGIQPKAPLAAERLAAQDRAAADQRAKVNGKLAGRNGDPGGPGGANGSRVIPLNTGPSFTGGHAISGTLNGGGTDIAITTLSGDVTLRKL